MKMKYTVGISLIVFSVFMIGVFGWGFLSKQQTEANLNSQTQNNSTNSSSSSSSNQTQPQNSTQPDNSTSNTNGSQSVTKASVATHNKASDCWIIISGNAYNVTKFLDVHPGGADVIIQYCGKDATSAFNTQGGRGRSHSSRAQQLLQDYLVGPVQ